MSVKKGGKNRPDTLFPFQTSVLNFGVNEHVKKLGPGYTADSEVVGVVTHILPKIYKLRVQWPHGNELESPEDIYLVNKSLIPASSSYDTSYDSYENRESERLYGKIPKGRPTRSDLVAKIANRYLERVAYIQEEVIKLKNKKVSNLEAYLNLSSRFENKISDPLLKEAINSVYGKK